MTPEGAYQLRRHAQASEFRKAWEAALACRIQRLEDIAMERATHGVEVPVYSYGKMIGERRVYNDALVMFLLRNRAARRFGADNWNKADVASKSQLKRLKQQWRKEWEEEEAAQSFARVEDIRASIDDKLARLREAAVERLREECSDRTRELYAAYEASAAEDARLYQQGLLPRPDGDRKD